MHPIKIRTRGFNQAAIIAKRLSINLGWPYAGRVIWRTRNTRPQFDIDFDERLDNVKDAFSKYPFARIDENASYMIVDDIITTGSTLVYCHKALSNAGAKKIDAFAVARAGTKELTTLVMQKVMY
jgi:predicted amidophosphoribosyltransferase